MSDREGRVLGRVDHLLETGSADVMVIAGPAGERHLVPFVLHETVVAVDLDAGCIEIDWNAAE